jgi:hypothetical protein
VDHEHVIDDLRNVVDLAWWTLVWRLREEIPRDPRLAITVDTDTLRRHFELLAIYEQSAFMAGIVGDWTSHSLIAELESELGVYTEQQSADVAETAVLCADAVRQAKSESASATGLLNLADQIYGALVSFEFAVPRSLQSMTQWTREAAHVPTGNPGPNQ